MRIFALLACAACFAATGSPLQEMPSRSLEAPKAVVLQQFKAPSLAVSLEVSLPPMTVEKAIATVSKPDEPLQVGTVRTLEKAAAADSWTPVEGGFVTRALASSEGAMGIRVKLELSGLASPLEVRVQGNDGRIESMTV